jgi:hypothetical protein
MGIRPVLFKETGSGISLNNPHNHLSVNHLPFRKQESKDDSSFLKQA